MWRTELIVVGVLLLSLNGAAWNNGPAGNAATDQASECAAPAYATHDWIADHALDFLPDAEKAWLLPHRALYLTGTEAPDNDDTAGIVSIGTTPIRRCSSRAPQRGLKRSTARP